MLLSTVAWMMVFTTHTDPISLNAIAATRAPAAIPPLTQTTQQAAEESMAEPLPELVIEPVTPSAPISSRLNRKPGILHEPIYDDQATLDVNEEGNEDANDLIIDQIDHQSDE
jgi:hypothetical protein